MIKVSDVVGALVRSITIARIQSDVVSSQASLEYLKDPVLKAYPVPRAEIQKAEIGMKLAILDIVQEAADPADVARKALVDRVPAYVDRILAMRFDPGAEVTLRGSFGTGASAAVTAIVATLTEHFAASPQEIANSIINDPKGYTPVLRDMTIDALNQAPRVASVRPIALTDWLMQTIFQEAYAFCVATAPALKTAETVGGTAGFDMGLAVRKDEVMTVPEYLVSDLKLSVSIENYEWTTATDAQGNLVNKLSHK